MSAAGTPHSLRSGGDSGGVKLHDLPTDDPNRYDLSAEHARGGLGRVLKAHDDRLGRTVAIKELLKTTSTRAEARFIREALITARLQHPGIVPVHEAGRWPSGEPYYVMKLISGESLKEMIAERRDLRDRLALLPNVIAVAEAIAYAHNHEVIHRDIKPSNVVVGEFGETIVVDWGLAKDLHEDASSVTLVEDQPGSGAGSSSKGSGGVMGTPAYMPPEQAEGHQVGKCADVYAIGAVLYTVLAGEPPYKGEDGSDIVKKVLKGPPPPVDARVQDIPTDLVAIVNKAMARDNDERYPSARELADDLKRFQTGQLVSAHDYSRMSLVRRWMSRHRGIVGAAIVFAIILGVFAYADRQRVVKARNLAETHLAQAQRAQQVTEERRKALVLLQAKTSLSRDPTAAMAWLKKFPASDRDLDKLPSMIDQARALGVAKHVLRHGDWVHGVAFAPDGNTVATSTRKELWFWDTKTGTGRKIDKDLEGPMALTYSRDGRHLAAGSKFGHIYVWDTANGKRRMLRGHKAEVTFLRFSSNNKRLLSASMDRTARVWNLVNAEHQLAMSAKKTKGAGAFAPDGNSGAYASMDGTVTIQSFETGKATELKTKLPSPTHRLAVSSDGRFVAAFGADRAIRLLDANKNTVRKLGYHPGHVEFFEFAPSGNFVVSAGDDTTVRVWGTHKEWRRVLRGHTDNIYNVVFTKDERTLVSAGDDATARVWDIATGTAHTLMGHIDDVFRVDVTSDGRMIATASLDGSARIWTTSFDDSRVFTGNEGKRITGIGFLDNGKLMSYETGRDIRQWDTKTGSSRVVGRPYIGLGWRINPLAGNAVWMSKNAKYAAARGKDGTLDIWDVASGDKLNLGGGEHHIYAVAFATDGSAVFTSGKDKKLIKWSLPDKKPTELHSGTQFHALSVNNANTRLAMLSDKRVRIWDLAKGSFVSEADLSQATGPRRIRGVWFTPNDDRILAFTIGDTIAVWTLTDGSVKALTTKNHHIVNVTVSHDGTRVAAAVANRTVHIWNLETGAEHELKGHSDLVMQVRFSPDGSTVASSSYDKTIRLWSRRASGAWRSRVLRGHAASVDGIAFSPDGKQLASSGRDGTVRLWPAVMPKAPSAAQIKARLDKLTTAVVGTDDEPVTIQR